MKDLYIRVLSLILCVGLCGACTPKKKEYASKDEAPREMKSADIERYYEVPADEIEEQPSEEPVDTSLEVPIEEEAATTLPTPSVTLVWKKANLTNYESYPDPGSEECIKYNGCQWAGMFAALNGKQPESWVKANNIIAVHGKDFKKYKLKTLRLKKGSKTIDAKVYDMCADSDCNGCCTKNSKETGFLIDIEKYSMQRFGNLGSGIVEWACVDCK